MSSFLRAQHDEASARSRTMVTSRHAAEFLTRGAVYEREGKLAQAAFLYRQAAGCETVSANALHRCGQLERQLGHPDNAIATLKTALHHATYDPGLSNRIFLELGDLYTQLGDYEEGAYYFRRALRHEPEREDIRLRLRMAVDRVRARGRRSPLSGIRQAG